MYEVLTSALLYIIHKAATCSDQEGACNIAVRLQQSRQKIGLDSGKQSLQSEHLYCMWQRQTLPVSIYQPIPLQTNSVSIRD